MLEEKYLKKFREAFLSKANVQKTKENNKAIDEVCKPNVQNECR